MASIIRNEQNKSTRIQFMDNGERRLISIGQVKMDEAHEFKANIEALIKAKRIGQAIGPGVSDWLKALPDDMHARIAAVGLVPARVTVAAPTVLTLGQLLADFIAGKSVKPSTLLRIEQAKRTLIEHFGADREVASITKEDALKWRNGLRANYSQATLSRTVLYAREAFSWAMEMDKITASPFHQKGMKAGSQINKAKSHHVDEATAYKLIDAAPDAEWRLLIALSRFGGLRVPSEPVRLRWEDVHWTGDEKHPGGYIVVHSPKTEHHADKATRHVPIFPELRPYLEDARSLAPLDAEYVIQTYRSGQNVNPQLRRIIKRADLKEWPRAWHNMRASRATDLLDKHPAHRVNYWLGHTEKIALDSYRQMRPEDWAAATGECAKSVHPDAAGSGSKVLALGSTRENTPSNRGVPLVAAGCNEISGQGRTETTSGLPEGNAKSADPVCKECANPGQGEVDALTALIAALPAEARAALLARLQGP
jgi:integrase